MNIKKTFVSFLGIHYVQHTGRFSICFILRKNIGFFLIVPIITVNPKDFTSLEIQSQFEETLVYLNFISIS